MEVKKIYFDHKFGSYKQSIKKYLNNIIIGSVSSHKIVFVVPNSNWKNFVITCFAEIKNNFILPKVITFNNIYNKYYEKLIHNINYELYNCVWRLKSYLDSLNIGDEYSINDLFNIVRKLEYEDYNEYNTINHYFVIREFLNQNLVFKGNLFKDVSLQYFCNDLDQDEAIYLLGFECICRDTDLLLQNIVNKKNDIFQIFDKVPSNNIHSVLKNKIPFILDNYNIDSPNYIDDYYLLFFQSIFRDRLSLYDRVSFVECEDYVKLARIVSYTLHFDVSNKINSAIIISNNELQERINTELNLYNLSLKYYTNLSEGDDAKLLFALLDYVINFGDKNFLSSIIQNNNFKDIFNEDIIANIDLHYIRNAYSNSNNIQSIFADNVLNILDDIFYFKKLCYSDNSSVSVENNILDVQISFCEKYFLNKNSKVLNILYNLRDTKYIINNIIEYRKFIDIVIRNEYIECKHPSFHSIDSFSFRDANIITYEKLYMLDCDINYVPFNNEKVMWNILNIFSNPDIEIVSLNYNSTQLNHTFACLKHYVNDYSDYWNNFDIQQIKHRCNMNNSIQSFSYSFSSNPELNNRPNKLSSTMIKVLISNPYMFYEKYILKIKEIEKPGFYPSNKEIGTLVHNIIEYITNNKIVCKKRILHLFLSIVKDKFPDYIFCKGLYMNKISKMAENFYNFHISRMPNISDIFVEFKGKINIKDIIVEAICDRIEISKYDGHINIIDFKTGIYGSKKEILDGIEPQLLIQAMVVENTLSIPVKNVSYYSLLNGKLLTISLDDEIRNSFKAKIEQLLTHYILEKNEFVKYCI